MPQNQLPQNQLPQNQLSENEIQNQVTPAQLVNQLPLNQLNQTTLSGQIPYQSQFPQPMAQNPVQQVQYPNSIPNQYQQMGQFPGGQYAPQNQFPVQGSPYGQPQYQPMNPPQPDQYLYQQQQLAAAQGYQNMQGYPNQQVITLDRLLAFCPNTDNGLRIVY